MMISPWIIRGTAPLTNSLISLQYHYSESDQTPANQRPLAIAKRDALALSGHSNAAIQCLYYYIVYSRAIAAALPRATTAHYQVNRLSQKTA